MPINKGLIQLKRGDFLKPDLALADEFVAEKPKSESGQGQKPKQAKIAKHVLLSLLCALFLWLVWQTAVYFKIWPFNNNQEILGQNYPKGVLAAALKLSDEAKVYYWLSGLNEEKKFLLFFQNNAELRPTGGFWGSYGLLTIKNGRFTSLFVDDIYHLDGALQGLNKNLPPPELKEYLNVEKFYIRDINWQPDFSASASRALLLYGLTDSQKIDGVMAITPGFIKELLAITGPLEVEGEILTAHNFLAKTQYEVSRGYVGSGRSFWERKEFLSAFAGRLKDSLPDSLSDLGEIEKWLALWHYHLRAKNILLYSTDTKVEGLLAKLNWAGKLRDFKGDYLMAIDANLASLKTDPWIKRQLEYALTPSANGLQASLKITYQHDGGFDWRTTRYRTYTRVYTPFGSRLLEVKGAMVSDRNSTPGKASIKEEFGKTVFGAFIAIEPKSTGVLEFTYLLPDYIKAEDYALMVQKQPGAENQEFILKIKKPGQESVQVILHEKKFISDRIISLGGLQQLR